MDTSLKKHSQRILTLPLSISLILFIVLTSLLASVPPVSRDALTHHLAVPKLYLQHGGMYEIPSVIFSYYPMNIDLLYLLPLHFGNDIAPNYIHFGFALLTAWLLFTYLKKKLDVAHALFGALFFLTTPIILKLSITAYVDLGLIFFSTATILYLLRWAESDFNLKFIFYSSSFCGLALGTKYNGMVILFFLTLFVMFLYVRAGEVNIARQIRAVGHGCFFFFVALMIFSPWMIRNYIWTRNPVYPLYDYWFNPKSDQLAETHSKPDDENEGRLSSDEEQKWSHFRLRKVVFHESLAETLTIPIRIFFQGRDDDPKFFDGRLNPFLFIFPLFAFWPNPSLSTNSMRREKRFLFAFSILYLFFVYVQIDMRIRWISPIIPPLVILSVFGLHNLSIVFTKKKSALTRNTGYCILFSAAALSLGMNAKYLQFQFDSVRPWEYISGKISRSDYICKYRPEYSVIEYANQTLHHDTKILALFLGNRIYYSAHQMDCNYEAFFKWLKQADNPDDLYRELKANKFSNLIVRFDALQRWFDTILSEKEQKLLVLFFHLHLKQIYAKNSYGLFALTDPPSVGADKN